METNKQAVEDENEVKKEALENLKKLTAIIDGLRAKIDDLKNALAIEQEKAKKTVINQCWWDTKACGRYSQLEGLRDAGARCGGCSRLDVDRINDILDQIIPNFNFADPDSEIEAAKEEAEGQAWGEIRDEILDVLERVEKGQ